MTPEEALTLVTERVILPRVGLSCFREMDKDILALRAAQEALALVLSTHRPVTVEYTHHVVGQPTFDIDAETLERMAPLDATHRREVYVGPWERMPDDEHAEAGSLSFGTDEP